MLLNKLRKTTPPGMCEGYAWSGGGRRIIRVDLTADGGKTWTSADSLVQDTARHPRHWGWTLWKVPYLHPGWWIRIRMDLSAVLRIRNWIRIHRIHMFWGLPDTHPYPVIRDMDPDPFIIQQK
jgi:hypothetical protein